MASIKDIKYDTRNQPRQIRLDTTTRCNATCLSCHRFLTNRKGEMEFSLIKEIINDVAHLPQTLTEIIPVNYGEFFLRDDWLRILMLIAEKLPDTNLVIPTNGSRLDEGTVNKLCNVPTIEIINFSVNAVFNETYEQFMGLPASNLNKIINAIGIIKRKRPDISIWTSMVFSPEYQTDLERNLFQQFWKGATFSQINTASSAGRGMKPINTVELPCNSIFNDMVIGYDRKISSCCFDAGFTLDLGWFEGDIVKAWRNDKFEDFRRSHNEHKRGQNKICSSCTFA